MIFRLAKVVFFGGGDLTQRALLTADDGERHGSPFLLLFRERVTH